MAQNNKNAGTQPEIEDALQEKFNTAARGVSKALSLDLDDVKAAYKDKPESLVQHHNEIKKAKSERNGWGGWSVAWAILIWPIAFYTVYRAVDEQLKLSDTKKTVKNAVEQQRLLPPPTEDVTSKNKNMPQP